MTAAATRSARAVRAAHRDSSSGPVSEQRQAEATLPALRAARLVAFDAARGRATIAMGEHEVEAALDGALSPAVVVTAVARGERAIVVAEPAGAGGGEPGWLVLGTLRTAPTPGVDEGEEFVIKAKRVLVAAEHEFAIVSGVASFVVRAQGYVETLARDITTRAAGVHKIVGRIVRLN